MQTEVCNSIDDNCNGVVDDPTATTLCSTPPNVASNTCSVGTCGIGSCNATFYNVNGTVSDGCECQDDTASASCTSPTNGGSHNTGANVVLPSATTFGKLPPASASDYYNVSFPINLDYMNHGSGTPAVSFAANGGSEFRFEIRLPGTCTNTALACGNGGTASGNTSWTFADTASGSLVSNNYSTRAVTWPASILIRVFRPAAAASCSQYQLRITR